MDIRVRRHAEILVDYSLKVKKGDRFVIVGSTVVAPLIQEAYRLGLKRGAFVDVHTVIPGLEWIYYTEANDAQLKFPSLINKTIWERFNKSLFIHGSHNTKALAGADTKKIQTKVKTFQPIRKAFYKRVDAGKADWVITMHPTQAQAQEANMPLERYEDFVYNACYCNQTNPVQLLKKFSAKQELIAKRLNRVSKMRIVAPGTDITFGVKGRRWVNCDGKCNMPDGEVFTGPIETATEGHIYYSYPAIFMAQEVSGIRLVFKKGKVVKATAEKGQDLLMKMLDTDAGARRAGELAIATNYGIKEFSKEILFDEKIGGSVHVALGSAFKKETNAKNESAIHWDMITDMKQGKIFADGKLIYEGGKFVKGW